ncbi:MAG: PDDEXK nuclease domain-containing protein [Eggerthellaceae bacterium]|nr:PDDEXK nuclease domain-containing protein [Eggerthellaceae bacterium]
MSTKKDEAGAIATQRETLLNGVDEAALLKRVVGIIESRKYRAGAYANREVTLMYWEIGQHVSSVLLDRKRAEYGKRILATLSQDLSWSHFREILPLKNDEARMYYAKDAAARRLSVRDLREQIRRKVFERREIANSQLTPASAVPFNMFKDPYLLDTLGLKENFLEADLENAILTDLEAFILEFGQGFTFVERQKRMNVGGEDAILDLLFYHRILKRLVAVELKLGRFKAAYKGQMELYLKWLDKQDRQDGEEAPIGIILCATANREKIELLEMDKSGIAVAEYWTHLPSKAEFEAKIRAIMIEARERLERRKTLPPGNGHRQVAYFYDPIGDGEDDE